MTHADLPLPGFALLPQTRCYKKIIFLLILTDIYSQGFTKNCFAMSKLLIAWIWKSFKHLRPAKWQRNVEEEESHPVVVFPV